MKTLSNLMEITLFTLEEFLNFIPTDTNSCVLFVYKSVLVACNKGVNPKEVVSFLKEVIKKDIVDLIFVKVDEKDAHYYFHSLWRRLPDRFNVKGYAIYCKEETRPDIYVDNERIWHTETTKTVNLCSEEIQKERPEEKMESKSCPDLRLDRL